MSSAASSKHSEESADSGLENISCSFANLLKATCERHITSLINAFSLKLVASHSEITKEECIEIWNQIVPEYSVSSDNTKKKPSTTIPGKICCFYYTRAKKECDKEVSVKSVTGKYCSAHYKEENKPEKPVKEEVEKIPCCHTNTKGDIGKSCSGFVSAKSMTGKYCSKHIKSNEKDIPPKNKKPVEDKKEVVTEKLAPRLNKELKVYADPGTGFVIDKDSKNVYARIRDGKITMLNDEDNAFLKKNKYDSDESLFAIKHPQLVEDDEDVEEEDDEVNDEDVEEEEVDDEN